MQGVDMANPLIRRYQYPLLRPPQVWIYGIIYLSAVALILIVNLMFFAKETILVNEEPWKLFRNLHIQFAIFQFILLWILAPYNVSTVISGEMLQKSYDFTRLLPLSARQKIAGIVMGRNLVIFFMAAVNFLFFLAFGLAGQLSLPILAEWVLFLLSISLLFCLLALLMSMHPTKKRGNFFVPMLALIFCFGFPYFLIVLHESFEGKTANVLFYCWQIPSLLLISGFALYFAGWASLGGLRWFTKEYDPLFSPLGAIVFLVLYLVLVLGLFYPYFLSQRSMESYPERIFFGFWMFGLIAVGLLPVGARKTYEKYLEMSRLCSPSKLSVCWLLRRSNLMLAAVLYLLWVCFCSYACWFGPIPISLFLVFAAVMGTFFCVLILLFETSITLSPVYPKLGYLTGFLFILYLFLPYILAALFEIDFLTAFSPLGYFNYAYEHYKEGMPVSPAILNIFFCLMPGRLVLLRYSQIVTMRKGLSSDSPLTVAAS